MSRSLSNEQIQEAFSLSAEDRYDFFLDWVTEAQMVYTLKDEQGCLLVTSEDESCLPVWPDATLAQACADNEWSGFEPLEISFADWNQKWLPGMKEDGHLVAVFPDKNAESVLVSPDELAEDLAG